mgnify:CR=1 FL=1
MNLLFACASGSGRDFRRLLLLAEGSRRPEYATIRRSFTASVFSLVLLPHFSFFSPFHLAHAPSFIPPRGYARALPVMKYNFSRGFWVHLVILNNLAVFLRNDRV